MSNDFAALRAQARKRRDNELARVREEYQENLAKIADLEQRLLGRIDPKRMPLTAAVESVLPLGEPFTTTSVMRSLEALDATRVWRMASVMRHIRALRERGLVRRMKRASVHEPAQYIRTDGPAKVVPVPRDRSLRDWLEEIVTKPMRTAEVMQAVKESGFQTTMIAGHLRTYVKRSLREAGYREVAGKWQR
ncbi:MAG TPA: hypothetical protein VFV87_05970 [Pirellulaceae bacterium]|nr:hypothetical protein [Pirellulaceae bacterium]